MKKLYKYQQEMVDRAGISTALFWDMGLGKTITSLEIFKKYDLQGLFVMCPVSMVDEWVREFESQVGEKAITYKEAIKLCGDYTLEQYLWVNKIKCVVLNYDMVWRIDDYSWLNERWMLICDESHRIKNTSSKIGKYMKFLKLKTAYKICLTGTPQSQGFIDYYNQLYFLDKISITLGEFKNRYCIYEDAVFNGIKIKQLNGYKNVGELEKLYLEKCEFLKIDRVYDEIVKYNYINLGTSEEYKRAVNDKVIFYDAEDNIITDRKEIKKLYAGLDSSVVQYKLLDNPGAYRFGIRSLLDSKFKHQWLKDFLEDVGDKRVVIFYNYNHELESIKRIVENVGRKFSVYNGESKNLNNFKQFKDGVAICNYKSGSFGINDLVVSNIFVAYSPTDNYLEWEQSKKRIDRDGQVNTPIYYFLESGIETRIYKSLQAGKNFDDRVFISEMLDNLL